ncbi:hypothetical protein Tco_0975911 [Tanacetum coccineum]|uniref:Uncharacterized protein n=1 Tax=Tanacetum coccineum TaxID=301880 RepID=A0ABQ5EFR0_9ASTR
METHGRKKAVGEPAPTACDPRDVETIERLQQWIQELELQQLRPDSPVEEAEIEPNVWDDGSVDVNPFGRGKPRYVNRLYQPRRNDHVVDRDDRYRDDPSRSLGLKIEIPECTCKVHPDDFIDWLSMVEQRRQIKGKSKVETWEKMKKLMKAKNMTVEEVINEFDKHRMRCDVVEEEKQVVARFLGVIKPEITNICSEIRNYACDCPNLKTLAFAPDDVGPIYDTDAEPELDELGDELVYPDRGEALVIHCENVVSTYMVEKLGVKTEDHLEPYQLTWLKKGNTVKVSKCCLVQFSIGKSYKDEVWCEVIPMVVAHILLGHPWQFDRKTKNDGCNTLKSEYAAEY